MAPSRKSQEGMTRREVVFTGAAGAVGLGVGALIGNAVGGGGDGGGTTASTDPIVIGGAYPLTGASAGDGVESKNALEMAAADLNARGGLLGRKVVVETADCQSNLVADEVRIAIDRLVNEKNVSMCSLIFCSPTNGEWDPVLRKGVPTFHSNALSLNTDWVKENMAERGMIFEICPSEVFYGPNLVSLMQRFQDAGVWKPRNKTAAIITSTDPYSVNIAETLSDTIIKAGWKVPVFEKFAPNLSEYGPILAKIRETSPDLVANTDWLAPDLAAFTKQFAANPTPSLVYEQFGPSTPEYLDLAGEAANGVLWSTDIGVLPDKIGEDFRARYDSQYSPKMGFSTAGAIYDQVMSWAAAVGRVGDPDDYPAVVKQIQAGIHRGIVGTSRYFEGDNEGIPYPQETPDASLGMPLLSFQIQNMQQVVIDPEPYVKGVFELPPQLQ